MRSWQQTGEIPLWCPYSFAGMPFAHDIQVAAFYPLHLPLYFLPEEWVAVELSWLIVVHVIISGLCMYAYASTQGLRCTGSLVAAIGYMFSGRWMIHLLVAGHYMTVGLAWMPLVLLALERAIRRSSLVWATWAGAAFALIVLGTHPQWTLYAGSFIALWILAPCLEKAGYLGGAGPRSWRRTGIALARWLGLGAWATLVAVALSAVQLLPALEAAAQASRGHTRMPDREIEDTLISWLGLLGPPLIGNKTFYDWEFRSGLCVVWTTAALMAPALCRGRVRFQGILTIVFAAFALGLGALFQDVPGFRLFPINARMWLIITLPVALLAGITTQALFDTGSTDRSMYSLARLILAIVLIVACVFSGILTISLGAHNLHLHMYWVALAITAPVAYWLLSARAGTKMSPLRGKQATVSKIAWTFTLLVDLWAMTAQHVAARSQREIFDPPTCVRYLIEHNEEHHRVLDRTFTHLPTMTPLGAAFSMLFRLEQLRGYNPLDIRRYREYLQFIRDDDSIRPAPSAPRRLERMVRNFPIKNKVLLDLLGTRYLVQPSDPSLEPGGETPIGQDLHWKLVYEEPHPRAFILNEGFQVLPAYSVYENREIFPRAFVVPEAAPLPDRPHVLQALKTNDFRRRVLLEGYAPDAQRPHFHGDYQRARIREYLPNRVTVDLDGGTTGFLVLTDIWFPGWSCAVDGRPVPLYRGNFLFRAVPIGDESRQVVFTFSPSSYFWGKRISSCAIVFVAVLCLLRAFSSSLSRVRRNRQPRAVLKPPES